MKKDTDDNRRHLDRIPFSGPSRLTLEDGSEYDGQVANTNLHSAYLVLREGHSVSCGDKGTLHLSIRNQEQSFPCRVVRVDRHGIAVTSEKASARLGLAISQELFFGDKKGLGRIKPC